MQTVVLFIESGLRGFEFSAAQRLGHQVIFLTQDAIAVDKRNLQHVTETVRLKSVNVESVLAALLGIQELYRIVAVISTSDFWVYTASVIAKHLSLTGQTPEAIMNCIDKRQSREVLRGCGFVQPHQQVCVRLDDAVQFMENRNAPIVLKPRFGTMSAGVQIVQTREQLETAFKRLYSYLKFTRHLNRDNAILAEEYLPGEIVSVELMRDQEEDVIWGLTDRVLVLGNEVVEMGFNFPVDLTERERIVELSTAALNAVGFGPGPCHIELILTEQGPVILEINPRVGGVPVLVINQAFGVNVCEEWIKMYTEPKWERPEYKVHVVSCREIAAPHAGRLVQLLNWDELNEPEDGVVYKELYPEKLGTIIQTPKSNNEIFARLMTRAKTEEEARRLGNRAMQKLRLLMEVAPYGYS